MEEVIYNAKFSKENEISVKPDLSIYNSETQEFINLSIAYAKKSKSDIVISKDTNEIISQIYVTVGMFFGGFKKAFLELAMKSEDFLILPINKSPDYTLKISANYNMDCENSCM